MTAPRMRKLSPTRVSLLDAADRGELARLRSGKDMRTDTYHYVGWPVMRGLVDGGLLALASVPVNIERDRLWELTAAGRAVLNQHRRGASGKERDPYDDYEPPYHFGEMEPR